jgi:hypothetical protein
MAVIVAVVRVVLVDAVQPLDIRAREPVAQRVDAAVPPAVVVVDAVVGRPRFDRRIDRDGPVCPAGFDQPPGAGPDLPPRDRVEPDERDLACRRAARRS